MNPRSILGSDLMESLAPHVVFDGYELIRQIGAGGFGRVWLCRSEVINQFFAIKFVPLTEEDKGVRELAAVQAFKRAAVASPHLMPVEHIGVRDQTLFYVMPLADGTRDVPPDDPRWEPATLGRLIRERRDAEAWFSSVEIRDWMLALLEAAQALDTAGLVHRDIKPENILFLQGRLVLSDISLLREDAEDMTELGTPGYRAPSWYVESGGRVDMYGIAATLFTMLTGHAPDKIGRGAFRWPSQGEQSLSTQEHARWLWLHGIVFRITAERASERYLTFASLGHALTRPDEQQQSAARQRTPWRAAWISALIVLPVAALVMIANPGWFFAANHAPSQTTAADETDAEENPWAEFDREFVAFRQEATRLMRELREIVAAGDREIESLKAIKAEALAEKRAKDLPGPATERPTLDEMWQVIEKVDPLVQRYKQLTQAFLESHGVNWRAKLEASLARATDDAEAAGHPLKGSRDRHEALARLHGLVSSHTAIYKRVHWYLAVTGCWKGLDLSGRDPAFLEHRTRLWDQFKAMEWSQRFLSP